MPSEPTLVPSGLAEAIERTLGLPVRATPVGCPMAQEGCPVVVYARPLPEHEADEVLVDEWECDGIYYLDLQSNMRGGLTFACRPMPPEDPEWLPLGVAIRIPSDPQTGRGACEARRRMEAVIATPPPARDMLVAPLSEPGNVAHAIPSAIIRLLRHWRTGHWPTVEADGIALPMWLTADLLRWFEAAVPRRPLPRPQAGGGAP